MTTEDRSLYPSSDMWETQKSMLSPVHINNINISFWQLISEICHIVFIDNYVLHKIENFNHIKILISFTHFVTVLAVSIQFTNI